MSCLGSRTSGVKDTPFLGSARGGKEAEKRLSRMIQIKLSSPRSKHATKGTQGATQVQAARRLTALLLHVWIDGFFIVWLTMEPPGWGTRKGFGWR